MFASRRTLLRAAAFGVTSGVAFSCINAATAQPSAKRFVETVLPATRFGPTSILGKEHWRIIGTTDVDSKGTLHAIGALDPFVFLDESLNPSGIAGLGGGKHPHAGLSAITYLSPEGDGAAGLIHAWDNHNGAAPPHKAGGLYIIHAGRGVMHHEENSTPSGTLHQMQLWVRAPEPLPKASYELYSPAQIPVVQLPNGAGHCRVMCGSQFGRKSPTAPPCAVQYLHVVVRPGVKTALTVPRSHRAFAYALRGEGVFGENTPVKAREVGLLSPSSEADAVVAVANPSAEDDLHFLLVSGLPLEAGPVYKKLGHGGSFIAGTEEGARKWQQEFEARGEEFGKK